MPITFIPNPVINTEYSIIHKNFVENNNVVDKNVIKFFKVTLIENLDSTYTVKMFTFPATGAIPENSIIDDIEIDQTDDRGVITFTKGNYLFTKDNVNSFGIKTGGGITKSKKPKHNKKHKKSKHNKKSKTKKAIKSNKKQ